MNLNDKYTREDETRFTLRINTEILNAIKDIAKINRRSAAKQIEFILDEYLKNNS